MTPYNDWRERMMQDPEFVACHNRLQGIWAVVRRHLWGKHRANSKRNRNV